MLTVDLTDAEIDEIIGDCSCTHLTFVRMGAEIRRRRDAERPVTPETLTERDVRGAMGIGDMLNGSRFADACRVWLGIRGLEAYVPCSVSAASVAEQRICDVINGARRGLR